MASFQNSLRLLVHFFILFIKWYMNKYLHILIVLLIFLITGVMLACMAWLICLQDMRIVCNAHLFLQKLGDKSAVFEKLYIWHLKVYEIFKSQYCQADEWWKSCVIPSSNTSCKKTFVIGVFFTILWTARISDFKKNKWSKLEINI